MCLSNPRRTMSTLRLSLISISLVLFAANMCAGDKTTLTNLELTVSDLKPNDLFPGAKAYAAKLTNTTGQTIPIELLQLPPGYSGGGVFYPCAVQFWNSKLKNGRPYVLAMCVPNTVVAVPSSFTAK
jgi:hypothetical protein